MTSSRPSSIPAAKSKLFAGLNDTALRQILDAAKVRRIYAQEDVTVCGRRRGHSFPPANGKGAGLQSDGIRFGDPPVLECFPGDVIGLVSLLANPPNYMASSRTVSESEFLSGSRHHSQTRKGPSSTHREWPAPSAAAPRDIHEAPRGLVTKSAESRLAKALLHLATKAGECGPREWKSTSPMNNSVRFLTSAPSPPVGSSPSGNRMGGFRNSADGLPCALLNPS